MAILKPKQPFAPKRKPDPDDMQNGMARAAMFGTPEEKDQVQAKAKKKGFLNGK